jgi:hypothetical protein
VCGVYVSSLVITNDLIRGNRALSDLTTMQLQLMLDFALTNMEGKRLRSGRKVEARLIVRVCERVLPLQHASTPRVLYRLSRERGRRSPCR